MAPKVLGLIDFPVRFKGAIIIEHPAKLKTLVLEPMKTWTPMPFRVYCSIFIKFFLSWISLNKTTSSFTEISNDAGLTGNSQTAVVTEFAAKKFYDGMDETPPYVRKNFVHKGVVNSQTETHFNAFTASAPFGFDPPSIKDFFVFQNGLNMEPDALTITQSGSIMVLSVDSSFNAQGYGFDFDDEIVAMGKFNS